MIIYTLNFKTRQPSVLERFVSSPVTSITSNHMESHETKKALLSHLIGLRKSYETI